MTIRLVASEGVSVPISVAVDQSPVTIGQASSCTIRLSDSEVAWEHCRISPHGTHFIIEDLGSHTGTIVNGLNIQDATIIGDGDLVLIGQALFEVQSIEPAGPNRPVTPSPRSLEAALPGNRADMVRELPPAGVLASASHGSQPLLSEQAQVLVSRGKSIQLTIEKLLPLLAVSHQGEEDLAGVARRAVTFESHARRSLAACWRAGSAADPQTAGQALETDLEAVTETLRSALELVRAARGEPPR
ncbi:MAG: FHA domain-containing protein [Chloroflexota bacterium]